MRKEHLYSCTYLLEYVVFAIQLLKRFAVQVDVQSDGHLWRERRKRREVFRERQVMRERGTVIETERGDYSGRTSLVRLNATDLIETQQAPLPLSKT